MIIITSTINKKIFSKLNCKFGFWQIKIEEESIPFTAFSTPQGQYEWIVMPFELKNAPHFKERWIKSLRNFMNFASFMLMIL